MKIMLYIILERIKEKVERDLAEEQAGFRPGTGTGDMLCAIQILIEKLIETRNEAYIIFIDYNKAFNSVNHSELFTTLSQMGFPMHSRRLIQALYTDQEAKIRWNGSHTDPFKIGKGVRQGCIISPHLFSTYTEQLMRESNVNEYGIKVGGRKISNLRYADDMALCKNNHEEATRFINELNKAGEEKNLKLNTKKTKYIHIGETDSEDLFIDADKIERVYHFKYLGPIKTNSGDCTTDINSRIGMAKKKTYRRAEHNLERQVDNTATQNQTCKIFTWTVMTYGTEAN